MSTPKKAFYTVAEAGALIYPNAATATQVARAYQFLKEGRLAEFRAVRTIIEANGATFVDTSRRAKLICAISLAKFQRTRKRRGAALRKPCNVTKANGDKFDCGADSKYFGSLKAASIFLGASPGEVSRAAAGYRVLSLLNYSISLV